MFPFQNKKLTIRERVDDLLPRMNLQEKIGQVNQHLYGWQAYKKEKNGIQLTENFMDHVEWGQGLGALYGLFRADPWSNKDYRTGIRANESARIANKIQSFVINHSRFKIPALIVEEMPHGHQALDSVSYPTNIGKGNSFDLNILRKSAELQAEELRLKGGNIALVSSLDLMKDPRWGRSEETFGESPFLTGEYTKAIIRGFQGNLIEKSSFLDKPVSSDARKHVGVVIKHLIGQGDVLGGHNSGTVPIGKRELMEVYKPVIDSLRMSAGVMAAYNDLDGIPCHANQFLIQNTLRDKSKFQGIVMADGTALDRLVDLYGSRNEAVLAALNAGIDLSLWDDVYTHIGDAICEYPKLINNLNASVKRVLSIKFLLGLFDEPFIAEESTKLDENISKETKINLDLARESITLLKNGNNSEGHPMLPLKKGCNIAVIGPHADNIYHWLGDYTAPQISNQYESLLNSLGEYTQNINYSRGSEIRVKCPDNHSIDEAMAVAKKADVILLTLGGSSMRDFDMSFLNNGALDSENIVKNTDTGENMDVASLSLGGDQIKLLRNLKTLNKPIVVVMVQGRPYDISEVVDLADAVLVAWYPGQQGPKALSDILFGKYQPTGKLSISYPRNSEQLPVYYYQRRVLKNENYFDESGSPLFKFGFGLSYTNFIYSDLKAEHSSEFTRLNLTVKNENNNDGSDTLIAFASFYGTNVLPEIKKMVAFKRIQLKENTTKEIGLIVSNESLKYLDKDFNWRYPNKIVFTVGDLTKSIVLKKV